MRCLRELLAQGIEIPLLFTHADDPGESRWFGSVAPACARARPAQSNPRESQHARMARARRAGAAGLRVLVLLPAHAGSRAGWRLPRRGALNMHGSLLAEVIAAGRRCTGRSSRANRRPGRACTTWWTSPMRARWWISNRCPSSRTTRRSTVSMKVAEAAETVLRAQPAEAHRGHAPRPRRWILRRARISGGAGLRTAASIGGAARARSMTWCAPWRRPFRARSPRSTGVGLRSWRPRVDAGPVRHAARRPACTREGGAWYADCADGRRLRIRKAEIEARPLDPAAAPPALANQPLALE